MNHFGLYRDDNLVFLHEQKGGRCLNPGLANLPSPFTVGKPSAPCPHTLPAPAEGYVPDEPLVRAMGPIQTADVFQTERANAQLLGAMIQMVGPIRPLFYGFFGTRMKDLLAELTCTNAAPMIMVGIEARHFGELSRLMSLPRTRNLIIVSDLRVTGVPVLPRPAETDLDWRAVGAAQLWEFVNG